MNQYYLRSNVQIEPLMNQWPVTLPMNAPIPYAYFITKKYVKIMESYIESPEEHMNVSKNPAFAGGPFVNYTKDRAAEVQMLLEKTYKQQAHMFELVSAIDEFYTKLENMAGHSLNKLYNELPECLRGRVELSYDLQHRPSIRFIESVFYASKYYDKSLQSSCLSLINKDQRPFVLSTPRLIEENEFHLNIPFDSNKYDTLSKLRHSPRDIKEIFEIFNVQSDLQREKFISFFTTEQPMSKYVEPSFNELRIRYLGHASILIEFKGTSILIDPFLSYDYPSELERYTLMDLPNKIDHVLITHAHLDHIALETLLQIRYKIGNIIVPKSSGMSIADPSLKLLLHNLGFQKVYEVDELEEIKFDDEFSVMSLPFLGEHHDLSIRAKNAYLIKAKGKQLFFAADSTNLDNRLYENIHSIVGDVDVAFIGMECNGAPLSWFYGPLLRKKINRIDDYSRHGSASDCEQALQLIKTFKCKSAYIYAMGLEPWLSFILGLNYIEDSKQLKEAKKFVQECTVTGITSKLLYCKDEFNF